MMTAQEGIRKLVERSGGEAKIVKLPDEKLPSTESLRKLDEAIQQAKRDNEQRREEYIFIVR